MSAIIHLLDIMGAMFSLLSTLFYIRAEKQAWSIAAMATIINGTLYGIIGIYGSMTLEAVYFISAFYGWYQWTRKRREEKYLKISHLSWHKIIWLSLIAFFGILIAFVLLKYFTNSKVPYLDSITTVLSLIAQWMMCKKIIETWLLWFMVDAIYVVLYAYKDISIHSILLVIYLGLAVVGYLHWQKLMKKERGPNHY